MRLDKSSLMLVSTIIATLILTILLYFPTSTPYSPYNSGEQGLSRFIQEAGLSVCSLPDIHGFDTVVIVVNRRVTDSEAIVLKDFVARGGRLIVFDEEGYFNNVSSMLGVNVVVVNKTVVDEVFKHDNRFHVVGSCSVDKGLRIVFYKPSYIVIHGQNKANVLVRSSVYSYIDVDGNGYYTPGEPIGSVYMGVEFHVGNGSLVIISDRDVAVNSIVSRGDNLVFLKKLLKGRSCFELSTINPQHLDRLKYWILYYESAIGRSYVVAILLFIITIIAARVGGEHESK